MWLVRESCPDARKHGAAFLAAAFQFPGIVDLADHMDGISLLLDVIDSLGLNSDSYQTDRQVYTMLLCKLDCCKSRDYAEEGYSFYVAFLSRDY